MGKVRNIFLGFSISIVLTIIFILIFSLVLVKTNFDEKYIDTVVVVISGICLLVGTTMSVKSLKKNGAIMGATIAISYTAVLYIISSVITNSYTLGKESLYMVFVYVLLGIIGGIIGINIKS